VKKKLRVARTKGCLPGLTAGPRNKGEQKRGGRGGNSCHGKGKKKKKMTAEKKEKGGNPVDLTSPPARLSAKIFIKRKKWGGESAAANI